MMAEAGLQLDPQRSWWPATRFALLFVAVSVTLLHLASGPLRSRVEAPLCETIALHTDWTLRLLGEETRCNRTSVASPRHAFRVVYSCTSIPATILLIGAMFAFPAGALRKLVGILVGVVLLYAANIARLVALYYVKIHRPDLYEKMHLTVWQSLLVVFSVAIFCVWAATLPRRDP